MTSQPMSNSSRSLAPTTTSMAAVNSEIVAAKGA